ncbi:PAS domain-containing protein [Phenylobacterium sp. LjRoot219]|uniref:sensor histidine kinase n=1 Tax=Phenylobacterium sp. LjRoot219 TaxID=3342283 RepID=UPI003ECDB6C4
MTTSAENPGEAWFLRLGGATAERIATHDWASTPLGPPAAWPSCLKTATAIALRSPLPMVLLWGEAGVNIYNDAYAQLVGARHPQLLGANVREAWPEAAEFSDLIMKTVLSGTTLRYRDQSFTRQYAGKRERRWLDLDYSPVPDESGQPAGVLAVVVETTERVLAQRKAAAEAERQRRMIERALRAEAAAAESQQRLSAAVALAQLGVFEWNLETFEATLDARAREIYGFGPDERITVGDALGRIDKEAHLTLRADWHAARRAGAGRRQFQYRIRLPDSSVRDVAGYSDFIAGPDEGISRVIGVVSDVTERRRAEERQRLLINELNHRVKNTLATVQSVAAQTLRSASDWPMAREAFEARLVALGATHDLLTRKSWRGADLTEVAASALAPFEAAQSPQITRVGPSVWMTAPRALALSMALHELATNAVKYGALSAPGGQVTFRWSLSGDGELILSWSEHGGPPVLPPARSGFGSKLLQRGLARELDAVVALTFAPEGLRCDVRFKLESGYAPPLARRQSDALDQLARHSLSAVRF